MGRITVSDLPEGSQTERRQPGVPRVITLTGPWDGAGRTTLALTAASALLHMGLTVGVVDMDVRSRALTRWLTRRNRWCETHDTSLVVPASAATPVAPARDPAAAETADVARLPQLLDAFGAACDIVIIDAPSGAGPAVAAAVAAADVIVSLVVAETHALDGLFEVDEEGERLERPNAYSRVIWEARRRSADHGRAVDWILARARAGAHSGAETTQAFQRACQLLGARLGPRLREAADWRMGIDQGLCALDPPHRAQSETVAQALRDTLIALKLRGLEGATLSF